VTLSDMRRLLAQRGIQLTKSLGQNFLHDGNQLRRIVDAAQLNGEEPVLEIGPGLGPLTEILISKSPKVLAIEKDARLTALLRERFHNEDRLELIHADAMDTLREPERRWTGWKLVSNLPYSVASPLLVELALSPQPPARMVATLQIEVAQRIAAKPDTSEYGILTLLLGLRYDAIDWFKIGRECFFPTPDVDSACVTLNLRERRMLAPRLDPLFTNLVKTGFSQRRKMMFKLLKARWPEDTLEAAFESAGIARQERAEKVSLSQFCVLAEGLDRGARCSTAS
jgi:16S rRNA (adenine1518-N6/adenine1519-N6)-dimethyltransferase